MHIAELLKERILVLDGAMGTMIQQYKLDEAGYRGERFKEVEQKQQGNKEVEDGQQIVARPETIDAKATDGAAAQEGKQNHCSGGWSLFEVFQCWHHVCIF